METKKVRTKKEILETLPDAINNSDRKVCKSMYSCSASLLKNEFQTDANPATYTGWGRLESQDIIRIEGEPKQQAGGKKTMSLKIITIPHDMAVELDLDEPRVPKYTTKDSQEDFDL